MKIASQTERQPTRWSSQSPILVLISGSPHVELTVFNPDLVLVQGARNGPGDDLALPVEDAVVAGAEEALLVADPAHAASQVGADIRHGYEIAPVIGEHIDGDFLFVDDPTRLPLDARLEERGGARFDLAGRTQPDPLLFALFLESRSDDIGDGRDTQTGAHHYANSPGRRRETIPSAGTRFLTDVVPPLAL